MKRGKFSLSNEKLLSCNMGQLIPCGIFEVLPGDTIQQATSALIRVSPLQAPVMHRVDARIHHWFVPHRLVWEDFEDFITGGPDGMDNSVFPTVILSQQNANVGSLADYLGVCKNYVASGQTVSALPFRAYQMIFNEWYRDQDLVTPTDMSIESGSDITTSMDLATIAWEKDYFTASRPWEQKGPAITIPLGDTAPVNRVANAGPWSAFEENSESGSGAGDMTTDATSEIGVGGPALSFDPDGGLEADLQGASAISVNVLREAMALQRYEEARARYGSRYVEYLRYLNVRSSDSRLQRPEYLGGGSQVIQFSEVLQTAEGADPVGELRGHGIGAMRSNRYRRFIEEHGYVISTLSVRPKTVYAQGFPRHFNRRTKEDFWQKELQHIGQQEVLNKEVYSPHSSPDGTFGFQDRYDEYRKTPSSIAGEFRESILDFWHMARIFASDPALNSDFVTCTPTDRIYAVPSQDVLYVKANHSIQARRLVAQTGNSYIF